MTKAEIKKKCKAFNTCVNAFKEMKPYIDFLKSANGRTMNTEKAEKVISDCEDDITPLFSEYQGCFHGNFSENDTLEKFKEKLMSELSLDLFILQMCEEHS